VRKLWIRYFAVEPHCPLRHPNQPPYANLYLFQQAHRAKELLRIVLPAMVIVAGIAVAASLVRSILSPPKELTNKILKKLKKTLAICRQT
jgi:hypothetical protein